MQPDEKRLFRALAREGLSVTREGAVHTVRLSSDPSAPPAEILLPAELPLEAKAVKQLANLAAVRHPDGGRPCRVCATPDFHPGDSGVAIGSVVASKDVLVPQAIGTDVNCGMRLHVTDLTVDRFLSAKAAFVEKMRGDYLLGTRDVAMSAGAMREMFLRGVPAWLLAFRDEPLGRIAGADLDQIWGEHERILGSGSLEGDLDWAPHALVPDGGVVRDDGLATVGRGNHFVEVQVVDEILDGGHAWAWGIRRGQVAFMVHSGSRNVGRYVGGRWLEKIREAWPPGARHPESGIFPLSWTATPDLCADYLRAEATASNYGFVNRLLLAELLRLRLREVYGPSVEAPLVADVPHNVTMREGDVYVARKGACPAHEGMPVIIPGSMGSPSYVCVGLGNERWMSSASHGAGRARSRIAMGRADERALGLEGVECVTLREERRIEEAPAAYKPIQPVIDAQVAAGTILAVAKLRPILTFKG